MSKCFDQCQRWESDIMKYDTAKLIYEALKLDARYVNGKLQLRKSFYFNEATGYISFKKIEGYTYHKTDEVLKALI